jgi:hypothetical protein
MEINKDYNYSEIEIIEIFEENINNIDALKKWLNYLVKKQQYALAKIYKNQIENIESLRKIKKQRINSKKYEIKTLSDIVSIINRENQENLLMDLCNFCLFSIQIKEKLSEKEFLEFNLKSFIWENDGIIGMTKMMINGQEVTIEPKQNAKQT